MLMKTFVLHKCLTKKTLRVDNKHDFIGSKPWTVSKQQLIQAREDCWHFIPTDGD